MSREARPLVNIWIEEGRKHPEGGKEFTDAYEKRAAEVKKRSIQEKKQGSLIYRGSMFWADITSQEDFDKKCREAVEDYRSGNFFLERIGRYREIDVPLTTVLINLRAQWIQEYEIQTAPEFMLLDMAITSYYHFLRLNEAVNNIMANLEWDYFAQDVPTILRDRYGDPLNDKRGNRLAVEESAHRLVEILQPVLDQYNRMFMRNLKALRDLRRGNILLNIGNVGQVNIGDKQINVEKNS